STTVISNGADAKKKGEARGAFDSAVKSHAVAAVTDTEDLRTSNRVLHRVCPIESRPPPLLAAVFPWDRDGGEGRSRAPGGGQISALLAGPSMGASEWIRNNAEARGGGSLRCEYGRRGKPGDGWRRWPQLGRATCHTINFRR
ncbi:hypothetical protein PIB30_113607, partial [Stylosanthes scabra]|nr:hypothetical protein [Stylosanthes scabra]